jgi:hypothetical protein
LSRYRRPAVAFVAAFVVAVAAACGGSSATPAASSGAGASMAPSASAVNPNDPNSILGAALNTSAEIKSFHIKIELNGTILASALKDSGDATLSQITSDLKLDGTTIEGDVDVAGSAAHIALNVPPIPAMGNVPITGDLILKDQALYYKLDMLGPKYTMMDLGQLASGLPVALPSTAASATMDVTSELGQLQQQLEAAGVKATLVGVDQIGGKDADHINLTIPLDMINQEIAASSPSPMVQIDSASVDFWIYKDNSQLAKVEMAGASSALGNLDLTITITNYNAPVSISAPAASDISTGS